MTSGPLTGLRVLDLTRLLPGGYASLLLADLGADVVKIEEPGKGDYIRVTPPLVGDTSAAHVALNRNKRSLSLNLKVQEGRQLFLQLAGSADVVLESFRPGVMDRLGVGADVLRASNPRLIYCAITGYGQDGPRSQLAGHDANYIGFGGLAQLTGEEGGRPVLPGVQIGDLAGGGMAAVISILLALYRREATGTGDVCDVSMMDGAMSWLTIHAAAFLATGEEPQREQMPLSGAYPCYRIYPAADGWITVGALEPQFWQALCTALDRSDLMGDAFATGDRRDEVIAELSGLFATASRAEWMERLAGLDVCVAPVSSMSEALADPQVRARGMAYEHDVDGVGAWTHLGNPIRLGSGPAGPAFRISPPALGEHTDEILAELGRSGDEIQLLRDAGAV